MGAGADRVQPAGAPPWHDSPSNSAAERVGGTDGSLGQLFVLPSTAVPYLVAGSVVM